MNHYTPDRWVVLQLETPNTTIHKVFAGWYGGYLGGDSWQLNSGIVKTELADEVYHFTGNSGSVYSCHKNAYGMSGLQSSILSRWIDEAETKPDIKIKVLSLDEVAII